MPRRLLVFLLPFVLAAAPSFAAGNLPGASGTVKGGALACFSIRPPDAPTNKPGPHTAAAYRTCDQLCAAKGAACTAAASNFNPPVACDGTGYDPSSTLCRCCAVR